MLPGSSRPVGDLTCSGVASSSSSSLFRGVVVIIDGSHPSDPGSIPGERKKSSFQKTFVQTSLPQLTTSFDPGRSILFLLFWCLVFWCLVFWCLVFWCLVFWCLVFGTKRRLCKNRPKIRFPTRCDVNEHDRTQTVIELRKL